MTRQLFKTLRYQCSQYDVRKRQLVIRGKTLSLSPFTIFLRYSNNKNHQLKNVDFENEIYSWKGDVIWQ